MPVYKFSGNTYPMKQALREVGGKWSKANQTWTVETELSRSELKKSILKILFKDVKIEETDPDDDECCDD